MIAADPYPWPYRGVLEPRRLALVVTGDQPAWAGRSLHVPETRAVIAAVSGAVRREGGVAIHVRHPPEAPSAVPGPGQLTVGAAGIDGFYGSRLDHELRRRGVDTLVLAGYGGEATVSSTLRSANDRGYECLTLVDAVAMLDSRTGPATLRTITMSGGIFGAIAPSSALLAALSPVEVPL